MNKLDSIAKQIDDQSKPPVHLWKPDNVGEIDIRIDAHGNWFHEGGRIERDALVKLFASVLWCEAGQHYLVTPVEKLAIVVEDAPFIIQQVEQIDGAWLATDNTHGQVIISAEVPVELRRYQGQWVPYVKLRYDLWARVNRSVYYLWVNAAMDAQTDDSAALHLTSRGYNFEVGRE